MARKLVAADLFCGGGGTSSGLTEAALDSGLEIDLTAINHWETAVTTHSLNHPEARHLCESLDNLNPRKLFRESSLDILWASPECTHHSAARGGKPMNDQSRATAWCVIRWAEALLPKVILIENVREFANWGPLDANDRPIKSKKGEIFRAWVKCLEALGYRVEHRILCAADYGDPTTRKRLFVYATLGGKQIKWPEPTHSRDGADGLLPWVTAREIIDWEDKGHSIYKRKKPLATKTMRRIMIGLEKYGLAPFLLPHPRPKGDGPRSIDEPVQTVTATSCDMMLAQPFIVGAGGGEYAAKPRSVEAPLNTVMCENHAALVQPFIIPQMQGGRKAHSVDEPLATVTTTSRGVGLANPFLIHMRGTGTADSVDDPVRTIAAGGNHIGLAEPYLVQTNHDDGKAEGVTDRRTRSVKDPLPTVAGNRGEWSVCQPFIVGIDHKSGDHVVASDKPLSTVTTKQRHAVCVPHLESYKANVLENDHPLEKLAAKAMGATRARIVGEAEDGRPIVEIDGQRYAVDIHFRMLKPKELAKAQGFPSGYQFHGNTTEVVKQIGNAVPKNLARSLGLSAIQLINSKRN